MSLELIIKYKMNEIETRAFKIALLWEKLSAQEFPNIKHVKLKGTGDPRRSILFKVAYKLVNETNGLIPDSDYRLYILSQLHTMKLLKNEQDEHPLIHPTILIGPAAWTRWRLWKERWEAEVKRASMKKKEILTLPSIEKISAELMSTKKFLDAHSVSVNDYPELISNKMFMGWVVLKRISPYFLVLSPEINKLVSMDKYKATFKVDPDVYPVDENMKKKFLEIFK